MSHSVWVNAALIAVVGLASFKRVGWPLAAAGAAAWLSHLLLDSLYAHGRGVRIGWPINDYRLNLPIPWLQTLDTSQPISWRNATVALGEFLTFGPLLTSVLLFRSRRRIRRPGRDN